MSGNTGMTPPKAMTMNTTLSTNVETAFEARTRAHLYYPTRSRHQAKTCTSIRELTK